MTDVFCGLKVSAASFSHHADQGVHCSGAHWCELWTGTHHQQKCIPSCFANEMAEGLVTLLVSSAQKPFSMQGRQELQGLVQQISLQTSRLEIFPQHFQHD